MTRVQLLAAVVAAIVLAAVGGEGGWAQDTKAGAKIAKRCAACHGASGISTNSSIPNLAGQNESYLKKQIRLFRFLANKKAGRETVETLSPIMRGIMDHSGRANAEMEHRASELDVFEIADVARYYTGLRCRTRIVAVRPEPPEHALRCDRCHNPGQTRYFELTPKLAGQKKNYLIDQIKAFRAEARRGPKKQGEGRKHYFMVSQSAKLTNREIEGLADYYSRQNCR